MNSVAAWAEQGPEEREHTALGMYWHHARSAWQEQRRRMREHAERRKAQRRAARLERLAQKGSLA